jgi:AIPR protein
MDRIIASLTQSFATNHDLDELDRDEQFERFANYCVVATRGTEESFSIEDVTVDSNEVGIDGLAVKVNGRVITDRQEIIDLASTNGYLQVNFIFIQAKTSESIDTGAVELMGRAVKDFFREETQLPRSEFLDRSRELKEQVYSDPGLFRQSLPTVEAFMVTTGRWQEPAVIRASMNALADELELLGLFEDVRIEPIDAAALRERYRRAMQPPEATITFDRRSTVPSGLLGGSSAYVGLVQGREFLKLIRDEEGRLRASLFEDNVRDFQGSDNPVNAGMSATISSDLYARFPVLNNGVTVIARHIKTVGDDVTVSDYQIVNGCQTANVIYAHADRVESDAFWVPLKVVATDDESLITDIVTATNSQTAVSSEDLKSRSRFERDLEQFFAAMSTEAADGRGLRYERRSRQYAADDSVVAARVISRRILVRSYVSLALDQPHRATGYVTELLRSIGSQHFVDTHRPEPYYASALAHWKLDNMFAGHRIARELKPARWYLLMAFRHLVLNGEGLAAPTSNKVSTQANKLRKVLEKDSDALDAFTAAADAVSTSLAQVLDRDSLRAERPVELLRAELTQRVS